MTNYANAQRWVDEIEKHILAQQQIMIEAAGKCAPIKKMISDVKAAAKNDGMSVKALNALILERKHLRNAAAVRDKLEDEDLIAELEMLRDRVAAVAGLEDLFSHAVGEIDAEIASAKAGRGGKVETESPNVVALRGLRRLTDEEHAANMGDGVSTEDAGDEEAADESDGIPAFLDRRPSAAPSEA